MKIKSFFLLYLADTPPVKDCSELKRLGITKQGYYYIDPSGERKNSDLALVYCDDGWTNVLERSPDGDQVLNFQTFKE